MKKATFAGRFFISGAERAQASEGVTRGCSDAAALAAARAAELLAALSLEAADEEDRLEALDATAEPEDERGEEPASIWPVSSPPSSITTLP
jgi:hypothetical protein